MKKKLSLILSIIMVASIALMGCNKEGIALLKAFEKTQKVKTYGYEGQATISMDVLNKDSEGSFIPKEASIFFPIDLKFDFDGKAIMDYDKSIKQEMNLQYDFMDIKTESRLLTEMDMSKSNGDVKIFMELPRAMKNLIGLGKSEAKYVYYTSDSLETFMKNQGISAEEMAGMNTSIDGKTIKELQKVSMELVNTFKDSFKKNADVVKSKGTKTYTINGKNKSLDMYEITLNKDNIPSILEEIINNEKFVKEYLEICFKILPEEMQSVSIDELLKEYKNNKDVIISLINESMKSLDKNSVIKIAFGIDNGYVVYSNTLVDFNFAGNANVKFNYEYKIYDINKDIKIDMPKENSKECVELYGHIEELMKVFGEMSQADFEDEEIYEEFKPESIDISKYVSKETGKKYSYRNSNNNSITEISNELVKNNLVQQRVKDNIGEYSVLYRVSPDKIDIVASHYYGKEKMVDLTKNKINEDQVMVDLTNPAFMEEWTTEQGTWCYVDSEKKLVETPAGKFHAIVLNKYYEDGSYEEIYYAEGVGKVKSINRTASGDFNVQILESIKDVK